MGTNKYNPVKDLISIQERVNKLFDDIMEKEEDGSIRKTWSPHVDIYETDDEFVVKAELPEVRRNDVEIKMEDNVLTIRGERKFQKDISRNNFHRVERKYGLFRRSFRLPAAVNQEEISADLKDGVLQVVLKKRPEPGSKRIEIT
jgi:HSP20 family protein